MTVPRLSSQPPRPSSTYPSPSADIRPPRRGGLPRVLRLAPNVENRIRQPLKPSLNTVPRASFALNRHRLLDPDIAQPHGLENFGRFDGAGRVLLVDDEEQRDVECRAVGGLRGCGLELEVVGGRGGGCEDGGSERAVRCGACGAAGGAVVGEVRGGVDVGGREVGGRDVGGREVGRELVRRHVGELPRGASRGGGGAARGRSRGSSEFWVGAAAAASAAGRFVVERGEGGRVLERGVGGALHDGLEVVQAAEAFAGFGEAALGGGVDDVDDAVAGAGVGGPCWAGGEGAADVDDVPAVDAAVGCGLEGDGFFVGGEGGEGFDGLVEGEAVEDGAFAGAVEAEDEDGAGGFAFGVFGGAAGARAKGAAGGG
eukprot:CAMPEP_0184710924 /NCGR_PEP_ID=MMETSP0314-20130426/1666_1 /TAXON_ID=38298 /ORGANISM="Rhodella maculata, Strain CCMP 736" /LENGTH=370 /DNA_ID=CAMNT_0027172885 /DNA_START=116 /DNA_END=1229 /DNA_ORIENTATION=-